MSAATGGARTYGQLLRHNAFLRVFTAGLASILGSSIASVCLIWIVFERTGSAWDVAYLGLSWTVASISFSVFGGTWVDRYDRRLLMVTSEFASAAAMASIALDLTFRGLDLLPIVGAYFVIGSFSTFFNPAEQSIIPSLVDAPQVADANGMVRSSRSALNFVGTAVAGVLIVTAGPILGVAMNAATFAISGSLLLGMRVPAGRSLPARAEGRSRGYFADVGAGFRWLYRARGLFQLTLSAMAFNFCSAIFGTFFVIFATVVLHGSGIVFAGLLAAEVAGAGVGSLLVGPTRAVRWAGWAWVGLYGSASGAVCLLFVLVPVLPVSVAAVFSLGCLGAYAGTAWLTAAQLIVPTEMQGRYFGIDNLGSIGIIPFAQIGGALLVASIGIHGTYLLTGLAWVAAGLLFLLPRALREVGYRAPRAPSPRTDDAAAGTPGSPEENRYA